MATPPSEEQSEQGRSTPTGESDLFAMEQKLLDRVRDVAQKITDRVKKALGDTETHVALPDSPTEETPPLS